MPKCSCTCQAHKHQKLIAKCAPLKCTATFRSLAQTQHHIIIKPTGLILPPLEFSKNSYSVLCMLADTETEPTRVSFLDRVQTKNALRNLPAQTSACHRGRRIRLPNLPPKNPIRMECHTDSTSHQRRHVVARAWDIGLYKSSRSRSDRPAPLRMQRSIRRRSIPDTTVPVAMSLSCRSTCGSAEGPPKANIAFSSTDSLRKSSPCATRFPRTH